MKRLISLALCLLLALGALSGCTSSTPSTPAAPEAGGMTAGTYTATVPGMHGPLSVEVTVTADAIEDVQVTSHVETPAVGDWAVELMPAAIVEHQSTGVDAVSGVTITSGAILRAVEDCLTQAGADLEAFRAYTAPVLEDAEYTADVIVVGGGGAGMSAAITAIENGASVILVAKMGFVGGNSVVSGGIYNAPDPSKQDNPENSFGDTDAIVEELLAQEPVSDLHAEMLETVRAEYEAYKKTDKVLFDSPTFFALQSWNGGDKVGDLAMMKIMCDNSLEGLKWYESMGMEFHPQITLASGSLYPRTHRAVMPNGSGYFKAFQDRLAQEPAESYTELLDTKAVGLIMDGDKVVGVNAEGKGGQKVTLKANNGVILATGGFAGNVELRQEYCEGEKWPDLGPNVVTSNMAGVTGDGIFFARDAGAKLVNMDQIQLLHICNPNTGATYDIVTVELFVNQEGKRFVREDGRRDEMSKAIIAQTGSIMYSIFSADFTPDPNTAKSLGGITLQTLLDTPGSGYFVADTLEELAEKLDMPADELIATVEHFNACVEGTAEDTEFGRRAYQGKKIITAPFYACTRAPAVHHTMGGVLIDADCRAIKEDGTPVPGLYCAGEITGVLHGANRIGGNAIVDFTVFGRIAGESAAKAK
jgi:urocanate reductase